MIRDVFLSSKRLTERYGTAENHIPFVRKTTTLGAHMKNMTESRRYREASGVFIRKLKNAIRVEPWSYITSSRN